jgi:hypothetical protein
MPVQSEVSRLPRPLTAARQCDTMTHMSLLRGLFWLVLFVFFAFCFVVLFEYGTSDFGSGFKTEAMKVKTYVMDLNKKPKKDEGKK